MHSDAIRGSLSTRSELARNRKKDHPRPALPQTPSARRENRSTDAAKRTSLEELDELAHAQHRLQFQHVRVEGLEDLLRETDE